MSYFCRRASNYNLNITHLSNIKLKVRIVCNSSIDYNAASDKFMTKSLNNLIYFWFSL